MRVRVPPRSEPGVVVRMHYIVGVVIR